MESKQQNKIVYRIIDKKTGDAVGSYSRAYHNEYNFGSAEQAEEANCHGELKDKEKYQINKYRVVYELLESDVRK